MVRRSQRFSTGGDVASKHKRAASGSVAAEISSKKAKKQQTTPVKSQYFDKKGDENDSDSDADDDEEEPVSSEETASEFGAADEESALSESAESGEDENDSDDAGPKKKTTPNSKSAELWRPGVKAGLGPGRQLVIKKPKARAAGKIPYTEETIHLNTLLFLGDLKENNDRQWLKLHDADFRQAEKDWHGFVEKMTEHLIRIDDTIPELPVKDVIFRIYRDVRFSKDQTPYKPHFSVAWSRAGRKSSYAHYYVQVAPNKSFVGGGLWQPEATSTASMRAAIDSHSRRLKDVLTDASIRKEFLGGVGNSDKAAVKAFVKNNAESALKTKPKGYEADHPELALLRLRSYTLGRSITDDEVLGEKGMRRISHLLTCLKPFITYCNSVVMPDEEEQDDSEEEEENGTTVDSGSSDE